MTLAKVGDWPSSVCKPSFDPGGASNPLGNGFDTVPAGVWPASTVATYGVLWLKPKLLPNDTCGIYEMPKPPRTTVLGASWKAAPMRGWILFQSVLKAAREAPSTPVKPSPP